MCPIDVKGWKVPVMRAVLPSPADSAESALSGPSDPSAWIRRRLIMQRRWCTSVPLVCPTRRPLYMC